MKQVFKKTKETYTKIVAAVMAALLGTTGAVMLVKNKTKDNNNLPEGTSISQEAEENEKLYLSEDFDINNDKEVEERARAIYELLEDELKKNITVNDIKNIIYVVNNVSEKTDLKTSDDIQQLLKKIGDIFKNEIYGYQDRLVNPDSEVKEFKQLIHAIFFIAKDKDAKQFAYQLAVILNKQAKNIENNIRDDKELAKQYEALCNKIYSSKLEMSYQILLRRAIIAYNSLFYSNNLLEYSSENDEKIKNEVANMETKLGTKIAEKKGIDIITKKDDDCNETDKEKKKNTKEGDHPNADSNDSKNYAGKDMPGDNKEADAGGQPVRNDQEVIGGGEILDTKITEGKVPDVVEGAHDEVEPGGEVLEENTQVFYSDANIDSPTKVLK